MRHQFAAHSVPALLLVALALPAQTSRRVVDINTNLSTAGSMPAASTLEAPAHAVFQGLYWFAASDHRHGTELWVSDGTDAGTRMLLDLAPGQDSSSPRYLTVVGSRMFFVASTPNTGEELWVTDGTAAGTQQVIDLAPGATPARIEHLVAFGNRLTFVATLAATGAERWVSDGTAAGTTLVIDLNPGPTGSGSTPAAVLGNRLVFVGQNPSGVRLWISDGTAAGTTQIGNFRAAGSVVVAGARAYFLADDGIAGLEPWSTDGTPAGTRIVADFTPGLPSSTLVGMAAFGNRALLALSTSVVISDGTLAGTSVLATVRPSTLRDAGFPTFRVAAQQAYFLADDGIAGPELWATDGSTAGTRLVADLYPGPFGIRVEQSATVGNRLAFSMYAPGLGYELFVTDGTAAGTSLVADIAPGDASSAPAWLLARGNTLHMSIGFDGRFREPWVTDLTRAGTRLVRRIAIDTTVSSTPRDFVRFGARAVFSANDGSSGTEPWITDGTAAGTRLLADVNPGLFSSEPREFTVVGAKVFFTANSSTSLDRELWVSDGTVTRQVVPGSSLGGATALTAFRGRLLFTAGQATADAEPWISDGTAAGTHVLLPGRRMANPGTYTVIGDRAFFGADGFDLGREPWVTDGTAAGTRNIIDILPHAESGLIWSGVKGGEHYYFVARTPATGTELWRTDGTTTGTQPVLDLTPGPASSDILGLVGAESRVFFVLGVNPWQLWTSDGTAAGTTQIGPVSTRDFVPVGGTVFFTQYTTATGTELWHSDGTVAGTRMVVDLNPGAGNGVTSLSATPLGHLAVFVGNDGLRGRELWVSDGTTAGTRLLADAHPTGHGSQSSDVARCGDLVVFGANDGATGEELHAIALRSAAPAAAETYGAACAGLGGRDPELLAVGFPLAGNSAFSARLRSARPNSVGALLGGNAAADVALGGGCSLLVAQPIILAANVTDAAGSCGFALPIPPGTWAVGARVFTQGLVLDSAGSFQGLLALANGVEILIGR